MTKYVGEQFRIVVTAKDYGSGDLDDTNVDSVTLLILDRDATVLVDEEPMSWDADEALWEYLWDTVDLSAGSYKYKVTVIGADGKPSWEWLRVRLAKNPTITA